MKISSKSPEYRGYCGIGLHLPKCAANVGSVLRAAWCWDASFIAITGKRYKKSSVDTMATYRHKPLFHVDDLKSIIPYDCESIAVEINENATNLIDFVHPERAFYVFGPEDGSLEAKQFGWCDRVVCIPAGCLNLAASVNVLLYDRRFKQRDKPTIRTIGETYDG
jgi:tRNA(Leu) C34 or U34 (ribose-2'-O)-methylase TrmL